MATMNKNRKKIMAVLALTLALACVAGGVLAKYVTSSTGGDSARVAYWGFDQSATIDTRCLTVLTTMLPRPMRTM